MSLGVGQINKKLREISYGFLKQLFHLYYWWFSITYGIGVQKWEQRWVYYILKTKYGQAQKQDFYLFSKYVHYSPL